tara:strand:- start:826 stop:2115 length:1290 start_codon:yes stop_codon:yes gene_type:complete
MKYKKIDKELFINNRKKLIKKIDKMSAVIFNSNDIMPTNSDGSMPFIQNSDLFWLSGIDQEDSVLLLFPDHPNKKMQEILFLKETNDYIAIWEGSRLKKTDAYNISGIRTVYWLEEMDNILSEIFLLSKNLYLNKNMHSRSSSLVQSRDDRFRLTIANSYTDLKIKEVAPIMHDLRSIKSNFEVDLIQTACNITEKGFRRILPLISSGIMEYEIEAELSYEFIRNRSSRFAYQPIIASGRNSCVLHYIENNKKCIDGDILLMDFGAEYANYASDLTRTIPVNGRFTSRQKAVYNSVLYVMKEATKMLRPGTFIKDYNKEVGCIMQSELIKLGLLDMHDVKNQDSAQPLYKKYFMHGTSHFLGLDVHDVGRLESEICEGMVFTCEPGIYILEEELGIRLENDIFVTSDGPFDLMRNIPIEVEEIEELMNS